MTSPATRLRLLALALLACAVATGGAADAPDFSSEVRPILANHCFKCHGPDEQARKARLRLDVRDRAIGAAKSGEPIPSSPASPPTASCSSASIPATPTRSCRRPRRART